MRHERGIRVEGALFVFVLCSLFWSCHLSESSALRDIELDRAQDVLVSLFDSGLESKDEDAWTRQIASPDVDILSNLDSSDGVPDFGQGGVADTSADLSSTPEEEPPPNILLIIADDFGLGASPCYDLGSNLAPTPNIESLCERGVVFENMWSSPTCSPTRANLLTGRFGYRTGVGDVIKAGHPGLGLDEWSIPRVLDANPQLGYSHACLGKWHVGPAGNKTHPNDMGFEHFSGLMIGAVQSYTLWNETTDGETEQVTQYATSRHIDRALAWIAEQQNPWFLWLGLISPHLPIHLPPTDLHNYQELSGTEEDMEANRDLYFRAMIEAMDREIGRLFAGIGDAVLENTVVIFVGDNGTAQKVTEAPYLGSRAKGSLYQGGIHVPLVIAGPGVDSGLKRISALTHIVDLYSTILDAAGADASIIPPTHPIDGVSLWPLLEGTKASVRDWVFSELFGESSSAKAGKTARDARYKLISLESGTQRFFDLELDPFENNPLDRNSLDPEPLARYESLRDLLLSLSAQ